MGISHIALAVKDLEATHRFYTDVMGFDLVKVEIAAMRGGKARHAFYSTGSPDDQMIAFWDLRDVPGFDEGYKTDISAISTDPPRTIWRSRPTASTTSPPSATA